MWTESNNAGWADDVRASVDMYNAWFRGYAPAVFRDARVKAAADIKRVMAETDNLRRVTPEFLVGNPGILPTLRMATCPPLARDRLTGLAGAADSFVDNVDAGRLPKRMAPAERARQARLVVGVLQAMLDPDLFPWIAGSRAASLLEQEAAANVLADRLCTSVADPIIRNAQEARQLAVIEAQLKPLGYAKGENVGGRPLRSMPPATYQFRLTVLAGSAGNVRVPVDCVVQPRVLRTDRVPILIEAKSAGDFVNPNKRRKEESDKLKNLQAALGPDIEYVLFLCGYFNEQYLKYEVLEGMNVVWEHRPQDLVKLGL